MNILQDTDVSQTVKFIARQIVTGAAIFNLTDEQTNETTTTSVTLQTDRYFTFFNLAMPNLVEDRNYNFNVEVASEIIFEGQIFVTNQTQYDINDGQYTQRTSTNEFIVIDG